MDGISQTYQRYHREIQLLKKQIASQKVSHENTLKQLQSSYDIIEDMRQSLRMEQANNLKLKAEVADKTNKITLISVQYEEQIESIKDMINAKDEQLRRVSSVLMVSDYDMIRLKVVNELEIGHREQVQALNVEINKKNGELLDLKTKHALIQEKYNLLTAQLKQKDQEYTDKMQETHKKHLSEVKVVYQTMQRNKAECEKWKRKYQAMEIRTKKQISSLKDEIGQLNRPTYNIEPKRALA